MTGTWRIGDYDIDEYQVVVSEVTGSPESFRMVSYIGGVSESEAGLVFKCDQPPVDGNSSCSSSVAPGFSIIISGHDSMRLFTPSAPDGLKIRYSL